MQGICIVHVHHSSKKEHFKYVSMHNNKSLTQKNGESPTIALTWSKIEMLYIASVYLIGFPNARAQT